MSGTTLAEIVRENVRVLRSRRGLSQAQLADRMKALGFPWYPSTVNSLEQKKRSARVEELPGLAFSLEVDVVDLLDPSGFGQRADIALGSIPCLPKSYGRSLVRADTQRTLDPTKIIFWREQDGRQVPAGWWMSEPDPKSEQVVHRVVQELDNALRSLGWEDDPDRGRVLDFVLHMLLHEVALKHAEQMERSEAIRRAQEREAEDSLRRAEEAERIASLRRAAEEERLESLKRANEAERAKRTKEGDS